MVCGEGNVQKPEPPWSVGDTDGAFHTHHRAHKISD